MEAIIENHANDPNFNKIESLDNLTKDPSVIKIYANGFQLGATLGDASIIIKHNNNTTAIVTMSLPALKTLSLQIDQIITAVSKNFGEVESFDEMVKRMKK